MMLPSLISNLIWGASEPEENGEGVKEEEVEHSTSEEAGDWVLISCEKSKGSSGSHSMASSDSDHDQESVCSDGSWIITPAPHFQGLGQSCEVSHPLEDLLIEHPTMSVYHHARTSNTNHKHFQSSPHEQQKTGENVNEDTNTNQLQRKVVFKLLQSQPRHRVAMHQDIFLTPPPKVLPSSLPGPRITKKALKRHNANVLRRFRGKQVQKSWSKSGRRRC